MGGGNSKALHEQSSYSCVVVTGASALTQHNISTILLLWLAGWTSPPEATLAHPAQPHHAGRPSLARQRPRPPHYLPTTLPQSHRRLQRHRCCGCHPFCCQGHDVGHHWPQCAAPRGRGACMPCQGGSGAVWRARHPGRCGHGGLSGQGEADGWVYKHLRTQKELKGCIGRRRRGCVRMGHAAALRSAWQQVVAACCCA